MIMINIRDVEIIGNRTNAIDWKYVVTAMQLKLCIMKHTQSLIVHNSVILVNNQDIFSKSNSSLYFLQVCSIKF